MNVSSSGPASFSRREFLAGAAAVWAAGAVACRESEPDAASHLPMHAPDSTGGALTLTHFTAEQATEIEAITARIFPTDDSPGAREAGAVHFIDRGMTTFAADQKKPYEDGLAMIGREVAKRYPGQVRFSALTEAQQDELLKGIEGSDFFGNIRFATIASMFALPKYGGNRDFIGWKLVGQESVFEYKPPFGWYDRPENQQALLGRVL
jgi:gluconate 2-dehydrogenase gamma chain